jgi:hypothetical protein
MPDGCYHFEFSDITSISLKFCPYSIFTFDHSMASLLLDEKIKECVGN